MTRHRRGHGEPRACVRVEIRPPPVERANRRVFVGGVCGETPHRQARLRGQDGPPAPRRLDSALEFCVRDVFVAARLVAVRRHGTRAARRRGDGERAVAKGTPRRSVRLRGHARRRELAVRRAEDVPRIHPRRRREHAETAVRGVVRVIRDQTHFDRARFFRCRVSIGSARFIRRIIRRDIRRDIRRFRVRVVFCNNRRTGRVVRTRPSRVSLRLRQPPLDRAPRRVGHGHPSQRVSERALCDFEPSERARGDP